MINREGLNRIMETLPSTVRLVAVSKFKSNEAILEAYSAGINNFGENRPQELKQKMDELPPDIKWHFIGHLQTNKIKMIIDKVHLIHSVDSEKLLRAIDREAQKRGVVIECLLQIFIASEESKQGLLAEEAIELIERREEFPNVRICGLMGMATFTDDTHIINGEFATLKKLFDTIRESTPSIKPYFKELSMGMSSDYTIALEHGSTIVRIGSVIFGDR